MIGREICTAKWIVLSMSLLAGCGSQTQPKAGSEAVLDGHPTASPSRTGPLSISEAVAPIPLTDYQCFSPQVDVATLPPDLTLELMWSRVLFSGPKWNEKPLLVTCHGCQVDYGQLIRFYRGNPNGFRKVFEFCFGVGDLEEPKQFWVGGHALLFFRHNAGGSSSAWSCRVVWLGSPYAENLQDAEVREIEIETPVRVLAKLIGDGQHSDPVRTGLDVDSSGLRFEFSIWNEGESNNFPTGGSVEGRFKLLLDDQGEPLRWAVDTWEVRPHEGQ